LCRPDSSVSIVTRLTAGLPWNNGLIPFTGKIFFSTSKRPDRLWGPVSLLFNGLPWLFSAVNLPSSDPDRLPPSTVEVMNEWLYASTPHTPS
jgi:hypothetical protein